MKIKNTQIAFDESERNFSAYRRLCALRRLGNLWFVIMMCDLDPPPGPPQNSNPCSGKKRTHLCWAILLAFAQTNTHFPKFSPWFCTRFSTNLTHVSGFFGGQNGTHVYSFLCVKSTHLGSTSLYIWHMWAVPPPGPSCRSTQIWFHQFMECIVRECS